LKVVPFADLIDAKISALSSRGFGRDFLDLFTAHLQRPLNWRALLLKASRNQLNDYNPIELENNLKLIELELEKGAADVLPCAQPPPIADLKALLEELRSVNADVARDLTQLNGSLENDPE
jgi:hypothetical protein